MRMQTKIKEHAPLILAIVVVLSGILVINFFTNNSSKKEQEKLPTSSSKTTSKEEVKHLEENVYLDVTHETSGYATYISVKTNLPDGTKMVITLKGNGYNAGDDNISVRNGKAKTTGFTNKGYALSPGTYTVNITMVKASLQSSSVKSVIGRQGEYLTGPYAVSDGFGGSGKIVEKTTTIKID